MSLTIISGMQLLGHILGPVFSPASQTDMDPVPAHAGECRILQIPRPDANSDENISLSILPHSEGIYCS